MVRMQDLSTKAGIARETDLDPRNPLLDALEPVGQIKLRGAQPVKVYDRQEAIATIAKALREAAAKYSKE